MPVDTMPASHLLCHAVGVDGSSPWGAGDDVELRETPVVPPLTGAPRDRTGEERTAVRERVVLAVLATGIDAGACDVAHEVRVDEASEPGRVELRGLDAGHDRAPTDRDEFGEQRGRSPAPERLDVFETRGPRALLVP